MEDISLHIMDIAENSLRAGAQNVNIRIIHNKKNHTLILEIEDDGKGMDDKTLNNAANPFFTTKDDKKFGLGLSLLSQAAEATGGKLIVEKRSATGIRICATFHSDHIDMTPIGNVNKTIRVLKSLHPEVRFSFDNIINNGGTT